MHYEQYQRGSGRKAFIESHWGLKMIKKNKDELNEMEYLVTKKMAQNHHSKMNIGIILIRVFMLINYLVNLYSHQKKNLNLTVVGQVSPKH